MVISPKRLPEVKNDALTRIVSFASGNSIPVRSVRMVPALLTLKQMLRSQKASSASMVRFPNMGNHTTSVPFNIWHREPSALAGGSFLL